VSCLVQCQCDGGESRILGQRARRLGSHGWILGSQGVEIPFDQMPKARRPYAVYGGVIPASWKRMRRCSPLQRRPSPRLEAPLSLDEHSYTVLVDPWCTRRCASHKCGTAAGNDSSRHRECGCCLRVLCYRNRTLSASGRPIVAGLRAGSATRVLRSPALRHQCEVAGHAGTSEPSEH
jgi:hypothetical protein